MSKFNPNQPRDAAGKWTGSGGVGGNEARQRQAARYPVTSSARRQSVATRTGGIDIVALDERRGRFEPVKTGIGRRAVAERIAQHLRTDGRFVKIR